ncbi:MAG: hypothetical protein DCF16_06350 [Alphaproteobacteria bacterium]|nr:MAG: hypothetical protein DCF16_06350 [Alphaproteobacteria bacterium]
MSETVETAIVEPGGWLAEFQRGRCAGDTALTPYQGLLADEIVLPQSAADNADPSVLVLASSTWTDAMVEQLLYIHGEFAPESSFSFFAHDYLVQAMAGGHGAYFARRRNNELALKCAAQGLKSMLADPHLEIFNLGARLHRLPPPGARKLAVQKGYRNVETAIRDLDKRLAELEAREPLMARHKTWLKSLRKVQFVPDAEMTKHMGRLVQPNKLRPQRKAEMDRVREEKERTDPAFQAARALCEMASLKFGGLRTMGASRLREVWPEGPDVQAFGFRVETDKGPRAALFYIEGAIFKKRLAVLIEQGNPLPLGSLSPSEAEYAAILSG